jgi:hypothetical protein
VSVLPLFVVGVGVDAPGVAVVVEAGVVGLVVSSELAVVGAGVVVTSVLMSPVLALGVSVVAMLAASHVEPRKPATSTTMIIDPRRIVSFCFVIFTP